MPEKRNARPAHSLTRQPRPSGASQKSTPGRAIARATRRTFRICRKKQFGRGFRLEIRVLTRKDPKPDFHPAVVKNCLIVYALRREIPRIIGRFFGRLRQTVYCLLENKKRLCPPAQRHSARSLVASVQTTPRSPGNGATKAGKQVSANPAERSESFPRFRRKSFRIVPRRARLRFFQFPLKDYASKKSQTCARPGDAHAWVYFRTAPQAALSLHKPMREQKEFALSPRPPAIALPSTPRRKRRQTWLPR